MRARTSGFIADPPDAATNALSGRARPAILQASSMETSIKSSEPPAAPPKSPGTRFPSVVIGLLLLGLIGAGWAAFRAESRMRAQTAATMQARRERDAADQARRSAEETIRRLQDERDAAEQARLSAEDSARQLQAKSRRLESEAEALRAQAPPPPKTAKVEAPPKPREVSPAAPPTATLRLADGAVYEGETANGKRHGKGTCTWPNGQTYTGTWVDDKRQGQGTCTWPNGEKYDGEWADDKRNGQGTYKWPNGLVQSGKWIENRFAPAP